MAANFAQKLGFWIKKKREQLGWSQNELAKRTKRSRGAIADLESGRFKDTRLSVLVDIAHSFGMKPQEFLLLGLGETQNYQSNNAEEFLSHRIMSQIESILIHEK